MGKAALVEMTGTLVVVHPQVQYVRKLCPETVRVPRLSNKSEKNVRGLRPHTFVFTFIAQYLTPDPLRTQFVCNCIKLILHVFVGLFGGVDYYSGTAFLQADSIHQHDSTNGAVRILCTVP